MEKELIEGMSYGNQQRQVDQIRTVPERTIAGLYENMFPSDCNPLTVLHTCTDTFRLCSHAHNLCKK
ncbi:hypothetical protein CBL_02844 [Carabus blaptoides fortunei]